MRFDRSILTRAIVVASFATTLVIFPAGARLGDKRPAEGDPSRYGVPVGETTAALKGSKEKVDIFRKKDTNITAEYDKKDEVWRISFQTKRFKKHSKEILDLLEKSGGEKVWGAPVRFRGNDHYVTEDGSLHGIYYREPHYKLVIMTQPALEATRLPQELKGRDEKIDAGDGTAEKEETEKEEKKSHFDDF